MSNFTLSTYFGLFFAQDMIEKQTKSFILRVAVEPDEAPPSRVGSTRLTEFPTFSRLKPSTPCNRARFQRYIDIVSRCFLSRVKYLHVAAHRISNFIDIYF